MNERKDLLSARMRRIRKKDTGPEMTVRRIAHGLGYRYRLHRRDLPGTPDLVFPNRRKVIFVHGCFWHQHDCRLGCKQPTTNQDYWLPKLRRNVERDAIASAKLREAGWQILVIWECQTRKGEGLGEMICEFLEAGERCVSDFELSRSSRERPN